MAPEDAPVPYTLTGEAHATLTPTQPIDPGCGNPGHAQPCRADPDTGQHWFQSTGISVSPLASPGGNGGASGHLARVRADVAAAAAEASTSDLIAQILTQLTEIRAELAALAAKDPR